jgi:hypothetical protein
MPSEEESCCFAEASRSTYDVPISTYRWHRQVAKRTGDDHYGPASPV